MTITETDRQLFEWACGRNPNSFSHLLFECIAKADKENKSKLVIAYPSEVLAMHRYQHEAGYWSGLVTELS